MLFITIGLLIEQQPVFYDSMTERDVEDNHQQTHQEKDEKLHDE